MGAQLSGGILADYKHSMDRTYMHYHFSKPLARALKMKARCRSISPGNIGPTFKPFDRLAGRARLKHFRTVFLLCNEVLYFLITLKVSKEEEEDREQDDNVKDHHSGDAVRHGRNAAWFVVTPDTWG